MKNKNDYGFYSGGYIFDRLDRAALNYLRKKWPDLQDKQVYTARSLVWFEHQLCDLNKTKVFLNSWECKDDNTYEINVTLRKVSIAIASGTFTFKVAKHNYCATNKGE